MRAIILWEEIQCNCFFLTQLFLPWPAPLAIAFLERGPGGQPGVSGSTWPLIPARQSASVQHNQQSLTNIAGCHRIQHNNHAESPDRNHEVWTLLQRWYFQYPNHCMSFSRESHASEKRSVLRTLEEKVFKGISEGFLFSSFWKTDKLSSLGIHTKEGFWLWTGYPH